MGNLTVALENDDEARLRRLAKRKYNARKGSISKVLSEGIRLLEHEEMRKLAAHRLLEMMRVARNLGGIAVKSRGELYER